MSNETPRPYELHTLEIPYGQTQAHLEWGKLAKQANGAVTVRVGNTVVLVAAVGADAPVVGKDFFPLMVDYREKYAASGRFPGGFIKREGRPSDNETLRARLIDRAIRPMFPDGFMNEVQVYVTVLSMDQENPAETAALVGASAALYLSDIPFTTPVAAVRVGRVDGKFIVNPTYEQIEAGDLDLVVAGHAKAINMVEAGAKEISEDLMIEALEVAHEAIRTVCASLEKFREECGKPKNAFEAKAVDAEMKAAVEKLVGPHLAEIQTIFEKKARDKRLKQAIEEIQDALAEQFPEREGEIAAIVEEFDMAGMRRRVIEEGRRADGRAPTEIRPIWSELDILPCTHGSAVFTRGQTQALASVTLGSIEDQQKIDDLLGMSFKRFMLHYNFPSYSVGEVRPPRGPGRREIGHGALAERAILPIIPTKDAFPYTMRVVVDILESNGSSSMATVCSGCLSLMDAGVPITRPVAGIAMGLIMEGDRYTILSDIQGIEDHLGDMDFKVTGTSQGITALQMDIKVSGVTRQLLAQALDQARAGREFILGKMAETIAAPRADLKPHAPRITVLKVPVEKIREVIGPGGKVIRDIVEKTGCKIDIEDDGSVYICSTDAEGSRKAIEIISNITAELEEGKIYTGTVTRVMESGAIVEILPGKDGMVHISELDNYRVDRVEDICREGDTLLVKVLDIDRQRGRVRLSRRAALAEVAGPEESDGDDNGGAPMADDGGEGGAPPAPRYDRRSGGGGGGRPHGRGPRQRGDDRGDRGERGGYGGRGGRRGGGGSHGGYGGGGRREGGYGGGNRDSGNRGEGGREGGRESGGYGGGFDGSAGANGGSIGGGDLGE